MPRSATTNRLTTAYHEAGHVAVAHHLGLRIAKKGVTIIPGEDYVGRASILHNLGRLDVNQGDAMRIKVERFVVMSLAGTESKRKFRPKSIRKTNIAETMRMLIGY